GGAAIYGAVFVAILVFSDRFNLSQFLGILLGATFISFLGFWDDSRGLRPIIKLLGQFAAACLLIAAGVQVDLVAEPWVNYAITILWVVGITNAMNLLDNMDGLSGGIAAVAAAFFFLLAAMSGQYLVASLAMALLGACLGFLWYNFNPASIFMGDAGSLFLGFVLAALGIKLRFGNVPTITWMIPIIVLGIPIFDTTLVTISRLRRRLNPLTTPGRDHVSHRLVAMGMTRREAVLTLYLSCGALGMVAMLISQIRSVAEAYIVAAIVTAVAVAALVKLEGVDFEGRKKIAEVGAKETHAKSRT
ncbi:MAG: MraY family glycosyltransferase, partial [Dehalococcoidia bacterium]|nr:MraY family glycosyltransferase [Dehalococcoidia bacterium]